MVVPVPSLHGDTARGCNGWCAIASRERPMSILVLGASGFLGRHVVRALSGAGHEVVAGVRAPPARGMAGIEYGKVDLNRASEPRDWMPLLRGVEVVINTVGIFRESHGSQFRQLHEQAPQALFAACRQAGVRRVIQVSA